MFSAIKGYLWAAGAAIFAGLLILVKVLTFQKAELKRENKGHVKKQEIRTDQAKVDKKVEKKKDENLKANDGADYDDYI